MVITRVISVGRRFVIAVNTGVKSIAGVDIYLITPPNPVVNPVTIDSTILSICIVITSEINGPSSPITVFSIGVISINGVLM
jgi:hypothetical protein